MSQKAKYVSDLNQSVDPLTNIVETECPKCGKVFVPAPYHVYKTHNGYYCSWSCFNHRNDKKEQKGE